MADERETELNEPAEEQSPTDQEVLDQSVKPFYYGKPQYKSDIDRRKELAIEQGHAEKYIVTDANPATGGVYPPSAVVTPYDPDVVAEHTPGEQVEEPAQTDPQTAQLKTTQKQSDREDPQTPASLNAPAEPATSTTPAEPSH